VIELKDLIDKNSELQLVTCAGRLNIKAVTHRGRSRRRSRIARESMEHNLNPSQPTAVICAGGYRSSAATSILQQVGFTNLLKRNRRYDGVD